jgi:hypothetical protein
MPPPQTDLRVLILADSKKLPNEVQAAFDHFRIQAARAAVVALVRRRSGDIPDLTARLNVIEALNDDTEIVKRLAELAENIEPYRAKIGLHRDYLLLVMSHHFNPWGVVDFQRDFDNPMPYVRAAAELLSKLCQEHQVDVDALFAKMRDPLLNALSIHYSVSLPGGTRPLKPLQSPPDNPDRTDSENVD